MNCFDCENCIEDYFSEPCCLCDRERIEKKNSAHAERFCPDFEPTKDARMNME